MKKILIIMLILFVNQKGFCNSIPNNITDANEKLIERLAQSNDVGKLQQLAFGIGIAKLKAQQVIESKGTVSKELVEAYTRLNKKSQKLYTEVLNKNPELKAMNSDERSEVFKQVIQKNDGDIRAILACVFSIDEIEVCLARVGIVGRITFATCVLISGIADIDAAIASAGTALLAMPEVIVAEITICDAVAGGIGMIECFLTVASDIIDCVENI